MTIAERILIVDDDASLLAGLVRRLGELYDVSTAESGAAALAMMAGREPFAAVLCDMRMPGMDGLETLRRIAELSPDTVRMMLTGNADQKTAIDAINQGNVFRFFNKPVQLGSLAAGIEAAIRQYRLVTAERQLLQNTLAGSIALLTDVLSLVAPDIFRRSLRIRPWAAAIARELDLAEAWVVEMAAELGQLGAIAMPPEVLARQQGGQPLSAVEEEMMGRIPEIGAGLIRKIPRLEPVAEAVRLQAVWFKDRPQGQLPVAARILHLLNSLDEASSGRPSRQALALLTVQSGRHDPMILAAAGRSLFRLNVEPDAAAEIRTDVPVSGIRLGDVLETDLRLETGRLVLAAGETITEMLYLRLHNLHRMSRLNEPIRVRRSGRVLDPQLFAR